MNRFVPLRIHNFKRLAKKLTAPIGLKHNHALELLAQGSGFEHYFHVSRLHADGQPLAVPTTLQCAGDVGFEIWHRQMMEALGTAKASAQPLDIETMRNWYRLIFEPSSASTTRPPMAQDLEVPPADVDGGERSAISATPVIVTYRRRRVLEKH